MSLQTDSELLEAIRKGEVQAFNALFLRYWKKAHDMAFLRVRCVEVSQEIVQDLFISLWEKRETLDIQNVSSYLYAAIKNRVLNYLESQLTRKKHWDYYQRFIPSQDVVTQNDVELSELIDVINNGIEHLPKKSQRVLKLNWFEGRSTSEIASLLNLSEKAIQYHLTQSVKKLRLHLKDFILLTFLFFSL